jgi:3-hydroxyisobutyrate dehydrogenase-like beta-hydroxyacid dehydrogenase
MKLVVNTLLGLGMQAIAESLALGSSLGLSHDLLFDTLAKTAVVAPAHVGKLASAKRADYLPQFPVRLMQKDFALKEPGIPVPTCDCAALVRLRPSETGVINHYR